MTTQTYANHAHRPKLWALTVLLAGIALVLLVIGAVRQPSLQAWGSVLLAVAVAMAIATMRAFALRLQDRIIRHEMHTRLARLGLAEAARGAALGQLIALRFASDAELPALLPRAVAERLTSDQIKRAVADWQADELRT